MCGIAGIISLHPGQVSHHRLRQMARAIAHRGPDGEESWINAGGTAGFGHRRLSVIDTSDAGRQPLHYLGRYAIVFNGEIYNYVEVRKALAVKGYCFQTQTDTEVILAAYACYKSDCLQHFDGMFAFAIWDEQEQTLFAARDRFGEKPFYYHHDRQHQVFLFASEMKALWAAGVEKQMSGAMLYNFFTLGYTQNPHDAAETAYQHVHKLPAGAYLHIRGGQFSGSTHVYWALDRDDETGLPDSAAVEKFRELFSTSVSRRLRSDVPLGTSLSGGLDSSSIAAAIMQQQPGEAARLQTFSAVFPGFTKDESGHIAVVHQTLGVSNHQVEPDANGLVSDFERLCYHQEEPFGSSSIYAQFKVFGLAAEHGITVLLDGQGADETLAGYLKYYPWYWQELYLDQQEKLADEMRKARMAGLTERWDWKARVAARMPRLSRKLQVALRRMQQQASPGLARNFVHDHGVSYYDMPLPGRLNNVLRYNTCTNGLEELLRYADRNSMAHSREVRLPFLNHELVAFIFSLPAHMKIRGGWSKWLLRESMKDALPESIVWRTGKVGFEPPQKQWMQHPVLQEYIHEAKKKLVGAGMLQPAVLQKKIQPLDAHAAENADWRYLVAATLMKG